MLKLWDWISGIGTIGIIIDSDRKNIILTNRIVISLFIFIWILFGMSVYVNGIAFNNVAIAITNISAITITLSLNHYKLNISGRVVLSWLISSFTFLIALFSKVNNPEKIDELLYVTPRLFILSTCIIPLLIFSFREIRWMILSLLGSFLPLILFDPIHNVMGVGFYDRGFNSASYPFAIVLSLTCYGIFIASGIFFKRINEKYESKNSALIKSLETANLEIQTNNKNLERLVKLRTKKVQDQARKFEEFSQMNSHNLRAPLTNIMSLLSQLRITDSIEEKDEILKYLEKACIDLDKVVHEINDLLANPKNEN